MGAPVGVTVFLNCFIPGASTFPIGVVTTTGLASPDSKSSRSIQVQEQHAGSLDFFRAPENWVLKEIRVRSPSTNKDSRYDG